MDDTECHQNMSSNQDAHFKHPSAPPGALAIIRTCSLIYPDQPNPLQVTALRKYWLDGPDPLDYITMYENLGDKSRFIPEHWHYIGFGLSDLHGDGRVHEKALPEEPSGYGFELTFRLRKEPQEKSPPTWPAVLMQALARYVFQSGNVLQAGDHVSWYCSLDGKDSRIEHMLMAEDAQLSPIKTALGHVTFIQIVGVCAEELKAAQHWNGPGVLELLRSVPSAGGSWLITDMRRGETLFEVDLHLQEIVDQGIDQEGSNLSGVSGFVVWEENLEHSSKAANDKPINKDSSPHTSIRDTEELQALLQKNLRSDHHEPSADHYTTSNSRKTSVDTMSSCDQPLELVRTKTLESVHLKFNRETGGLLPLALRGRLKHGRHFTFKNPINDVAVTFVSPSVTGSLVDNEHKYATHGQWLQVLIEDDFIDQLSRDLDHLSDLSKVKLPEQLSWPLHRLTISLLPDNF